MPIFDDNDFSSVDRALTEMPDGMVEGVNYYKLFCEVNEYMKELDPTDSSSKVKFIMSLVNNLYNIEDNGEKEYDHQYITDMVSCLAFHLITLLNIGVDGDPCFKDRYVEYMENDVKPIVKQETEFMPYWSSNE